MENRNNYPVSTGNWVITLLITAIPLVNIVMLFVWAFSSETNASKSNWAKASLIWLAIVLGIYIVIIALFGSVFLSALSEYQ